MGQAGGVKGNEGNQEVSGSHYDNLYDCLSVPRNDLRFDG
jgi:hypothetical protein